jgi:hypothetical protein
VIVVSYLHPAHLQIEKSLRGSEEAHGLLLRPVQHLVRDRVYLRRNHDLLYPIIQNSIQMAFEMFFTSQQIRILCHGDRFRTQKLTHKKVLHRLLIPQPGWIPFLLDVIPLAQGQFFLTGICIGLPNIHMSCNAMGTSVSISHALEFGGF